MTEIKAPGFQAPWRLNLCSRIWHILLAATLVTMASGALAVNLKAVYYASCKREIGVIVNVDESNVAILSLDGTIKTISRFDIIYLAYYPVGELPIAEVTNGDRQRGISVKTLFKDEIVDLVKGWPVDFSEEKISFLSLDGQETVIDRDSIWGIEVSEFAKVLKFSSSPKTYEYVHPYPFSRCPAEKLAGSVKGVVYPGQILGDRLIIKNELDRLMAGYEK
ncbi:MAG: hypothetical protein HQK54_17585, partial [Oligoflexales bacterium]|nr:hypothetical protein [Oligoflexales bacterium]